MRVTRTVAAAAVGFAVLTTAGCLDEAGKGSVSDASGAKAAAAGASEDSSTATWGKRYTWPDGLAVEISKPVTCKPGEYSSPQHPKRAVKLTLLVINGTKEQFDPGTFTFGTDAQFDSSKAQMLFDSDGGCGGDPESTTILPGKSYKTTLSFVVGAKQGELQVVLQPKFDSAKAVFVGNA
jgi:hypothetical protein